MKGSQVVRDQAEERKTEGIEFVRKKERTKGAWNLGYGMPKTKRGHAE